MLPVIVNLAEISLPLSYGPPFSLPGVREGTRVGGHVGR